MSITPPGVTIPQIGVAQLTSPFLTPGIVIPQLAASVVAGQVTGSHFLFYVP